MEVFLNKSSIWGMFYLISKEDHPPHIQRDMKGIGQRTARKSICSSWGNIAQLWAEPGAVHFCPQLHRGIHPWRPAQNAPGSFSWVLSLPRNYCGGHSDRQSSRHMSGHWHAQLPLLLQTGSPPWLPHSGGSFPQAWGPAHSSWQWQLWEHSLDQRDWSTEVLWLYRLHVFSHQWYTECLTGTLVWSCKSATRAVHRCSGGIPGPHWPELLRSRLPGRGGGTRQQYVEYPHPSGQSGYTARAHPCTGNGSCVPTTSRLAETEGGRWEENKGKKESHSNGIRQVTMYSSRHFIIHCLTLESSDTQLRIFNIFYISQKIKKSQKNSKLCRS